MIDDRINPYAFGPAAPESAPPERPADEGQPRYPSLLRTAVRWTFVCGIAAAPSYVLGWGITNGNGGMLAAVFSFILLYIFADYLTRSWPLRRQPAISATLVTVYTLRIFASVVFPVGLMVDIPTGMVMMSLTVGLEAADQGVAPITGGYPLTDFWTAYRMTCVHAVLMNLLLAAVGLLLYPLIWYYTDNIKQRKPWKKAAAER